MNLPSIKTLERAFPGKGRALRKLLESPAAVRAHPAAVALDKECYNAPTLSQLRLEALDAEAETHGVEYVRRGRNAKSPAFRYLNTGDTYTATIVRFESGRYAVTSMGDIVEKGRYD